MMKELKEKQVGKWTVQIRDNANDDHFDVTAHAKEAIGKFYHYEEAEMFYHELTNEKQIEELYLIFKTS